MAVLASLKRSWRSFRKAQPGQRFREAQRRRRASRRSRWSTWLSIAAGVVLAVAGIAALPLPGPGMLVIAVGVALIAREWAFAAKVADQAELRLRAWAAAGRRAWKRSHAAVKVALLLVAASAVAASCYGAWLYWDTR